MRRRLIAWKTNVGHPTPAFDRSLSVPMKKLSWSRNPRCKWVARIVGVQSLLLVVIVGSTVIIGYYVTLRLLRYTKENDPFYKALRFGNVSAVVELYNDLNYTTILRNDVAKFPVVFYNLYIPPPPQRQDAAFDIVKEQLNQIQTIAAQFTTQKDLVVHLITVASNRASAEKAKDFCDSLVGLQCYHLRHAETADEMFALDGLYQYCIAHPSATVTYLHSKGSFHQNNVNDAWRRALTAAALHPDCWRNEVCDVCGLQFFTQFTLFWPGNMWTASCQYVNKLIPPRTFTMRQEEAVAEMLVLRLNGVLKSQLLRDRSDYFGLDRYAAEHWIGSHPDLQPCDMDPSQRPQDIFKRDAGVSKVADAFQFGLAPRHVGFAVGHNFEAHERLHQRDAERKQEIYLLPGRIFLWHKLYRRAPPSNSWAWKWFPDGVFWKSRLDGFRQSSIEDGPFVSFFHSLITSTDIEQTFWPPGRGVIFFFIIVNEDFGVDQVMDQMEIQRQDIGPEWAVVATVFNYSRVEDFSWFCESLWTECHVQNTGSLWDTAIRMTGYCKHQKEPSRIKFCLLEYTCRTNVKTAYHRLYVGTLNDGEPDFSCNKKQDCALNFAVQCSFVQQLIQPISFLRGVEAATKIVLLANVRNERRRKQSPTRDAMTIEQFLFFAWIAIHPMTQPCDVCNELVSFIAISDRDRDLILAILLVVEVFYENQSVLVPPCAQQWKNYLHIPSSVLQYVNISSVEEYSHRIYQAMQ